MVGLNLRLIFASGTDGAGTGAVGGTVAIILVESSIDKRRTVCIIRLKSMAERAEYLADLVDNR